MVTPYCCNPKSSCINQFACINVAAGSVVRALENPKEFSPQILHTNLCTQFQKLGHSIQRPNLKFLTFSGDSPMDGTQTM
ncbi:hypothetical protein COCNU_scaffold008295G000010 [Cocos nucifera]|nr:hypothetical protein [Cocos nucifera]